MSRLVLFCPLYNELPWTPFILRHLLEYDADLIVLSEGNPYAAEERSSDGTLELMRNFTAGYDNVRLVLTEQGCDMDNVQQHIWWEVLEDGDWYVNLGADNFFDRNGLARLRALMADSSSQGLYQALTSQMVFLGNFRTFALQPWAGICGCWVSLWNCIYRKTPDYGLKMVKAECADGVRWVCDELLYSARTGAPLLDPQRIQAGGPAPRGVSLRRDIMHYHYRGLRNAAGRTALYGDAWTRAWLAHPLNAPYLARYDGPHPEILDDHPWRHVEDCRTLEEPSCRI